MTGGVLSIVQRPPRARLNVFVAALALTLTHAPIAFAWGPHARITSAAQEALGPNPALARHLGREFAQLPAYCWMADWRRSLIVGSPSGAFYADDHLLFPSSPVHREHEWPFVAATYRPFFHRAVQALRTESPVNAARWIGSLLHFVEDSGSPPHAFPTPGELHTRMENWVDAGRIELAGYRPSSLGETEAEAVEGFMRRMDELTAYSRARGVKLLPLAVAGRRPEAEPIELESALETSRVVADVLVTLGRFVPGTTSESSPGTATLRSTVASNPAPGFEALPAKVVLEGTNYSTLADTAGGFVLRNLSPGDYRVTLVRPGSEPVSRLLTLAAGEERIEEFTMPDSNPRANLARNPMFTLRWVRAAAPDGWYPTGGDTAHVWQGELVPVVAGRRYRLAVAWKPGEKGTATLVWGTSQPKAFEPGVEVLRYHSDKVMAEPGLAPGAPARVFAAPEHARFALIVFDGASPPQMLCTSVALSPESL